MSKEPKEFEISKLLELTGKQKYASTVAAFEVIEFLEQLDVPRKIMNRKPSIKALSMLADGLLQWDFIDDETRLKLEEDLRASRKPSSAFDAVFSAQGSTAPMVDDSDEDLDEIVETEPPELMVDDSEADGFDDQEEESTSSDDSDDSNDDSDDSDNDSDDSDDDSDDSDDDSDDSDDDSDDSDDDSDDSDDDSDDSNDDSDDSDDDLEDDED